ncbi:uncharacterized protein LOC130591374 [Beta vulgaris subsp. vulgaris]|uniref:uncharacterized protein LOC130591374 n=1 Tax=Beta vulgaris subsp. vulgaris TaxID=3555 RepID=UPI002546B46F|nr:uncharacterized protein LOC130591374 [Beta vulgaris subsp. vulgaris]
MPSEVNESPKVDKRGSEGEVEKLLEEVIVEDESDVVSTQEKEVHEQRNEASQAAPKAYVPSVPFPQRLANKQLNDKFMKFLEVMKGLQVHIPFLQAMSQMPTYAKFLKELLSNKTKLEESATIALTVEVSVVLQNKLPKKLEDPRSFSIPLKIGDLEPKRALADLGVSVSLMPLSIAKQLNFELKPIRRVIQLADRSVKVPIRELEDVSVQVRRIVIPCDFVVMEMEEDSQVPHILGRPFLKTVGVLVDMKRDVLTLRVGDENREFAFKQSMKSPIMEEVKRIDSFDEDVLSLKGMRDKKDPLVDVLLGEDLEDNEEGKNFKLAMDASPTYCAKEEKIEALEVPSPKEESSKPPPKSLGINSASSIIGLKMMNHKLGKSWRA